VTRRAGPHLRSDGGGVTAEFAVAVPAALAVAALLLGGVQLAALQVRLQDAAADVARTLGRGERPDAILAALPASAATTLSSSSADGLVCARLTSTAGPLPIDVSASACALDAGG